MPWQDQLKGDSLSWLTIGALVFAGLIGVLGGLYPTARAARLDPIVALKHE